jgi:hypothetical protein
MKKLLLISLLAFSLASINLEAGFEHLKIVNDSAGCEFLVKGSTRIINYIPFVFKEEILRKLYYGLYLGAGFSQAYTAPRESQFIYNHHSHRFDISLGFVFDNFEAIYTHSVRETYDGANPDVLFWNKGDVDSIKLRWKGEL